MGITTRRGMYPTHQFLRSILDTDPFEGRVTGNRLLDGTSPAINISESETEYGIELIAPGYDKEDFNVDVTNNVLTISAAVEEEANEEGKEYTRQEYIFSSFSRSFNIPDDVADGAITAAYSNGVLYISLPKTGQEEKVTKPIQVQ